MGVLALRVRTYERPALKSAGFREGRRIHQHASACLTSAPRVSPT